MSDLDPTRPNEPVGPIDPPGPAGPLGPPDGPGRNVWAIVAALLGVIVVVLLALLFLGGDEDDDDADLATDASTTSTVPLTTTSSTSTSLSSTTSTTSRVTTTTGASTTSTSPKTTIAPARCDPKTSSAKPAEPAVAFYDAWRAGDRACADRLGTDSAVSTLFALKPNGPGWDFQGCTQVAQPEPYGDCAFTYEGGSTHFKQTYSAASGWSIFEVYQVAD